MSATQSTARTGRTRRHLTVVGPDHQPSSRTTPASPLTVVQGATIEVAAVMMAQASRMLRRRTPNERTVDHPTAPVKQAVLVDGPPLMAVVSAGQ